MYQLYDLLNWLDTSSSPLNWKQIGWALQHCAPSGSTEWLPDVCIVNSYLKFTSQVKASRCATTIYFCVTWRAHIGGATCFELRWSEVWAQLFQYLSHAHWRNLVSQVMSLVSQVMSLWLCWIWLKILAVYCTYTPKLSTTFQSVLFYWTKKLKWIYSRAWFKYHQND